MESSNLPRSDSSDLIITQPTSNEMLHILHDSADAWRGPISYERYLKMEERLPIECPIADRNLTPWILTTQSDMPDKRLILASCETIRNEALISFEVEGKRVVQATTCQCVASVFCTEKYRNRGYASRMLRLLDDMLSNMVSAEGAKCIFSVLWSDIGKRFYCRLGWQPLPSDHLALGSIMKSPSNDTLLKSRPLFEEDLKELCHIDVLQLTSQLNALRTSKIAVAIIPSIERIDLHLKREELTAVALSLETFRTKGAIVGDKPGHRAWCIWTRLWQYDPLAPKAASEERNTLNILRLVIEDTDTKVSDRRNMIASLLLAAQLETGRCGLDHCEYWSAPGEVNPAAEMVCDITGMEQASTVSHINREVHNIASLRWYGLDDVSGSRETTYQDIDWVAGEKHAWN